MVYPCLGHMRVPFLSLPLSDGWLPRTLFSYINGAVKAAALPALVIRSNAGARVRIFLITTVTPARSGDMASLQGKCIGDRYVPITAEPSIS